MRIGIDARFLTHPQRGGFKTYTENLVQALAEQDGDNEYVLYVDRKPGRDARLPNRPGIAVRVVSAFVPIVGMPWREQAGLRMRSAGDRLDLLHALCNTGPAKRKGRLVLTLHDTIQVTTSETFPWRGSRPEWKRWAISAYSRWAIRQCAASAAAVITVSGYEKGRIVESLGIPAERVSVTYLAPNSCFTVADEGARTLWRRRVASDLRIRGRFLLGIGYEPRKNIPLLIEAFARLAPRFPGVDLVIVAAEAHRRALFRELISGRGLGHRIILLEGLPPTDLAMLYNLAEAFVFPSERESFGLPPLEACACGCPVIAMRAASLPEILLDAAVLVEGRDPETWAESIARVVADDGLRSDLSHKGVGRAAQYSWQRCADETLAVYRTVARANREPARDKPALPGQQRLSPGD